MEFLFANLVINKAFKIKDVYKVEMPRWQIFHNNIDELVENKFTVYSRFQNFRYYFRTNDHDYISWYSATNHIFNINTPSFNVRAVTELVYYTLQDENNMPKHAKIQNPSRMHPKVFRVLKEQMEYLDNLFKIGFLDSLSKD